MVVFVSDQVRANLLNESNQGRATWSSIKPESQRLSTDILLSSDINVVNLPRFVHCFEIARIQSLIDETRSPSYFVPLWKAYTLIDKYCSDNQQQYYTFTRLH